MDAVVLRDVPPSLWDEFHERPRRSSSNRFSPVLERWCRAHDLGAPPEGPPDEEYLVRGEALREREERLAPVRVLGDAVLSRAQGVLAASDFVLLLADADGVIVSTLGGGRFADEARRLRLIAGATWNESARGTNAIGTTLAEERPAVVHGRAHYARRFHSLVCYAAPVRDALGRLVGVIDATSFAANADAKVGAAVLAAAASLEEALRLHAYAGAGVGVARALSRAIDRMSVPALLVEASGRILRANERARADVAPFDPSRGVAEVLGVGWDTIAREAIRPTAGGLAIDVTTRGGYKPARLRAEPIETADGRVFAALVSLDFESTAPARPIAAPSRALAGRSAPQPVESDPFAPIFGDDPALRGAITWARRIARSELPVVLLAETGSGKELFAHAIHRASTRHTGPFVAVNCGAIAPQLLESTLFGYAPGAFTGADRNGRDGLLQAAAGGTLFLDEVAEMPLAMQAALLRVLESHEYLRVGETRAQRADVRIVCATCRDLPARIADGTFRSDLYYRLKGVAITLPPLRARRDIVALARHLLATLAERDGMPAPELAPALASWITQYAWPGNVRELKTVLDVARVMAGHEPAIDVAHLPPDLHAESPAKQATDAPGDGPLEQVEGWAVRRVLDEVAGNVSAAARRLGVARSTIYRMMRRHGVAGE